MSAIIRTEQTLLAENAELRARLEEAEATLRAIRDNEIDAFVVDTLDGKRIYTLGDEDAESNRFRGAILEQISDAVIVLDDEQRLLYLNAASERQYGVLASAVLGRKVYQIYENRWLQPDDSDRMMAGLGETGHWRGELIHVKRNGEAIHVEISATRLRADSELYSGLLCVVRDITGQRLVETALRENEQRMRLAIATTGVGIWEWSVINDTIRWDLEMFRIHGLAPTPDGFVDYPTWSGAVLPEDLPRQEEVMRDTIRRQGSSSRQFRIRRANDGECRYIMAEEAVRTNAEGRVEWLVGTNLDITERVQAEQELKDAARRKDDFLAMLAHELRNPLAPIRNAVQIQKHAGLDRSRLTWCTEMIDRQLQHLTGLVDDLLDVSRISRGQTDLKLETLEIRDFIHPAVETSLPLIDSRRQTFSLLLPPERIWVEGDRIRLTQVLANLITNAAKYTQDDGHIAVSVEADAETVLFRVKDDGRGIDPADLNHLFDLFYQAERNLDRSQGGLGIGLSLVRGLVEMHGGDVRAFSAGKGRGSEFLARLPRKFADEPKPAVPVALAARFPGSLSVLLVDDNIDAAESLAVLLDIEGYPVRIANDGLSALAIAKAERPDVILLDIGLPGMDGYAVAQAIRLDQELARTRLIALTGYGQPADREKSLAAGFDEHLVKPPDIEKLRKLLSDCQPGRSK